MTKINSVGWHTYHHGFRQAMRLETTPVLRTNHHTNSSSEQMPCSREEGEMGTQNLQNPLLARNTDTSLSLKYTSDIQRESPSRNTNEWIQSCLRKRQTQKGSTQWIHSRWMNELRSEHEAISCYSTHLSQERTRSSWTKRILK
jgi:hypothetical protein